MILDSRSSRVTGTITIFQISKHIFIYFVSVYNPRSLLLVHTYMHGKNRLRYCKHPLLGDHTIVAGEHHVLVLTTKAGAFEAERLA